MLTIETKELKISDKLKRKIDMIGRFTNTTPHKYIMDVLKISQVLMLLM